MEEIEIYTDGGCRGNPGLGSYAAIIYRNGVAQAQFGDCYTQTTNNEMEVSALLIALSYINAMVDAGNSFMYSIYSDSAYVVNTFNDWIDGWTASGQIKRKANSDLWQQIYALKVKLRKNGVNLSVNKVKGHSDVAKNVEVDKLVNRLMDEQKHTDLMLKFPNLKYLQQNQLTFSVKDESEVKDSSPLFDITSINDLTKDGKSLIVNVGEFRVQIPIEYIKIALKDELELE